MESCTGTTYDIDEQLEQPASTAAAGDPAFPTLLSEWEATRRKDCRKRNPRGLTKCLKCNKVYTSKLYSRHVKTHTKKNTKIARVKPGNTRLHCRVCKR